MTRFLTLALLLVALVSTASAEQTLDRIVAVVDDDVVLASELEAELEQTRNRISQQGMGMPPADELRRQVLERLVMQRLQRNRAERRGIAIDSASLNAAVRRVAQQNDMTLPQFRDALAKQDMTISDVRERLRRELTLKRLRRRAMQQRVSITDQEIDQYIEQNSDSQWQYKLAHILIAAPEGASPEELDEARNRAEEIKSELSQGGEFGTLAATWSDSRTALEGGGMGWRERGEVPDPLAERLPDMEPGDVTSVLRTPSGFHLFKLADRRRSEREVVTQKRARQILIRTNDVVNDDDARQRLASLRQRIRGGNAEFAELASANSDDPGSASKGGDMGWLRPQSMPSNFARQLERLAPGEMSEPFRSRFGWHLVKVTDEREKDITDKTLRREAKQALRERKRDREVELWLRQLRDEAYIDYRLSS